MPSLRGFKQPPVAKLGSEDGLHALGLGFLCTGIGQFSSCIGLVRPDIGLLRSSLGFFALCRVSNIALNQPLLVHDKCVADKLHLDPTTILRLQRDAFVAKTVIVLQFGKRNFRGRFPFERTDLPQFPSQEFFLRIAEQILHERVGIDHLPRIGVQDQDAILCRLKQPPITQFRRMYRQFSPRLGLLYSCVRLIRACIGVSRFDLCSISRSLHSQHKKCNTDDESDGYHDQCGH